MGKFFIRCKGKGYLTKSYQKRCLRNLYDLPIYVRAPGDHRVKTWPTREAAERFLSHRDDAAGLEIVEAPSFWRLHAAQTDAEWDTLADFENIGTGADLKAQIARADEILTELMAEQAEARA